MDAMGGALFLDGEWESLCKLFSTEQDLDLDHLLGHNPQTSNNEEGLLSLLLGDTSPIASFCDLGAPLFHPQQPPNTNHLSPSSGSDLSYGSSNGGAHCFNGPDHQHLAQPKEDQISSLSSSFDFLLDDNFLMGQLSSLNNAMMNDAEDQNPPAKRKGSSDQTEMEAQVPAPKKRSRATKPAEKGKKKVQAKKRKNEANEEDSNADGSIAQNMSCDISDNESSDSQEVIDEAPQEILNSNGKRRAERGAATDPQSLYARKRRERINERLRILQNLVPNGTKVDISTMLEEAVNYVKFLQLQIKLLSSDEMWMYAPLAYNGFDIGHYNRFTPYMLRP